MTTGQDSAVTDFDLDGPGGSTWEDGLVELAAHNQELIEGASEGSAIWRCAQAFRAVLEKLDEAMESPLQT